MNCNAPAVALVLAAGFSKRFGVRDKRAVRLPTGKTLLGATYAAVSHLFCCTWVVLRENDDPRALGLPVTARIIRTSRAALGMGASLADGFTGLMQETDAERVQTAAVFLADMPLVNKETCQALLNVAGGQKIVRPTWQKQLGHPVLFGRKFWPELAKLGPSYSGAHIVARHKSSLIALELNDNSVCMDIDMPDDLYRPGFIEQVRIKQ